MRYLWVLTMLLLSLGLALGCSDDDDDAPTPSNDDDGGDDDDGGNDDDDDDGPPPDYWAPEKNLGTDLQPEVRGWRIAKGIIHMHSVYSHDACDGEGIVDGVIDEACRTQMREAICETQQDYVMMTDHPSEMRDYPFEELFNAREGDGWIEEGGKKIASVIHCDHGDALMTVGWESKLMPVMLTSHLDDDPEVRREMYGSEGPETVEAIRANGALVGVPHSESRDYERMAAIGPDAMEVYQLHANIDPGIREDYLGLEAFGFMGDAFAFLMEEGENLPHPDLVFLSFFSPNDPSLELWERLMNDYRVTGTAATDAHRNSLPNLMSDGERVDSYRRMMKWFSNWLLVDDLTPASLKDALGAGRNLMVFEIFGVPTGFDFYAESDGDTYDMGEDAPLGATIRAALPSMLRLDPTLEPPDVSIRLIHVDSEGNRTTVAESQEDLQYVTDQPGAYRAEVRIVPYHLEGWLGTETHLIREFEWILTNPIYVH